MRGYGTLEERRHGTSLQLNSRRPTLRLLRLWETLAANAWEQVTEANFGDSESRQDHRPDLSWGEVDETDEETAEIAGAIACEGGPQGPFLTGMDGLIAAVGRAVDAPVVSSDSDLTHEETERVVDVEEYR